MTKDLPLEKAVADPTAIDIEISTRVRLVAEAAGGRQAIDLRVLKLDAVTDFTDYFVICSGNNQRQVQAIAQAVDKDLRNQGVRPLHEEGLAQGQWVLYDYGDFVVHIFADDRRHFYRLENLWADALDVTEEYLSA